MNKKQRAKLKKKLGEIGIYEYTLFPFKTGYKLRWERGVVDIPDSPQGLTKGLMEGVINEIKRLDFNPSFEIQYNETKKERGSCE